MNNIFDIISDRGDELNARVTETDRKVITIKKGDAKFSATKYPSGRIVTTQSYMPDSPYYPKLLEDFG